MERTTTVSMLVDYPVVYMVDPKLQWEDFKKAVKSAALAWNFREWLNTTVYGGDTWRDIEALGFKVKDEAKGGDSLLEPLLLDEEEEKKGAKKADLEPFFD